MSLTLKHSHLAQYPKIESCLVALIAYTCYFFSNGITMSGIVSLLFCGITLKHYAYHTMSRRTQRATKYLFSILAQLSENFIFIYLGLSLFTSPPSSSKVTSYFKPIFIIISTVSVIFVRYAAVFPLSEAINLFQRHVRGQRSDEIPYSYQMMLFWAGLRGAVGVALAAGFKGENAEILRTTVLVVVVLTVVMFGGTTARMLELLGIRTGVEDETALSSDDEDTSFLPNRSAWYDQRDGNGAWNRYFDDVDDDRARVAGAIGTQYYNHHISTSRGPVNGNAQIFSAASSDSLDSDGEVLPLATPPPTRHGRSGSSSSSGPGTPARGVAVVGSEDGKWFQAIDERYLLPLFSNATASRTFHARRARRGAAHSGSGGGGGGSGYGGLGPSNNTITRSSAYRSESMPPSPSESETEADFGGRHEIDLRANRNGHGHTRVQSQPQSPSLSQSVQVPLGQSSGTATPRSPLPQLSQVATMEGTSGSRMERRTSPTQKSPREGGVPGGTPR